MKLNLITIYLSTAIVAALFVKSVQILSPGSDAWAIGQFVVELLLVPSIILTLNEIRKIQAIPELDLFLTTPAKGESKEIELFMHPSIAYEYGLFDKDEPISLPTILIRNSGKSIARWYVVQINLIYEISNKVFSLKFGKNIKDGGKWLDEEIIEDNGRRRISRYTFMSNGQLAIYPEISIPIGDILPTGHSEPDYSEIHKISYKIYSDNARPKEGTFTIKLTTVPPK